MKEVPTSLILFWYCIGGILFTLIYLVSEAIITGEPTRFSWYTARQIGISFGSAAFDSGSLINNTIAYKADKSGFVSLFSYMTIVYAYLCDIFLLDESLNTVELIAALTILVISVFVAYYKLRKQWQEQRFNSAKQSLERRDGQEDEQDLESTTVRTTKLAASIR